MLRDGCNRAAAVGHVGGCDMHGMRKPLRIHDNMAFYAGYFFASVITFLFGGIGVLHTLRVNDSE